jgi:putative transposase
MKRLQAFKFELRANGGQQRQMRRFAGSCRFVYNKALAWQIAAANMEAGDAMAPPIDLQMSTCR